MPAGGARAGQGAPSEGEDTASLLRAYRGWALPPWLHRTNLRWYAILTAFAAVYFAIIAIPFDRWFSLSLPSVVGVVPVLTVVPAIVLGQKRQRLSRRVAARRGLVCPCCLYPLAAEPALARCPECGEVYLTDELPALWSRGFGDRWWRRALASAPDGPTPKNTPIPPAG